MLKQTAIIEKLDHTPAVCSAMGGREETKCECVLTATCNTVQCVSLTGSPAKSNELIQLQQRVEDKHHSNENG